MFESLGDRLGATFDRLTGRGVLSAADVDEAMREVRVALLEADVALPVVKDFIAQAREQAMGEAVLRSVKPSEQVVKIVHDGLVEMLGGDASSELDLNVTPPAVIMMAGLQGSGKTTTAAKLGLRLQKGGLGGVGRKRVLMASLDTRRPAAMEQLATLGQQAEVDTLPIVVGQGAPDIARRAPERRAAGRLRRCDPGHRRPHHAGRGHDERGGGDRPRRQSGRNLAGGRQPDRSGRGAHGARLSTSACR
jgi:signal recognition particle subunit SRP54